MVLILGAGFSRAISRNMPMTLDLGKELVQRWAESERAHVAPTISTGEDLERWLSKLAEPQPYLDDVVNAQNSADFVIATRVITDLLRDGESTAMTSAMPDWLARLVQWLHVSGETVITFNYDTLLESATTSVLREALGSRSSLPAFRGDRVPLMIRTQRGLSYGRDLVDTFRLIKLHGSLDAWWVPGDFTGATIEKLEPRPWGDPQHPESWDPDHAPAGKRPFIVPPASAKSAFYANPISRQLWLDAMDALSGFPQRVSLVGYSLPATDLTVAGMISHALADHGSDLAVDVVDPSPSATMQRLEALGVQASAITAWPEGVSQAWVDSVIGDPDTSIHPPAGRTP